MKSEEYYNSILNRPYRRGICHLCGNSQSHNLRWCAICGTEFCKHNHTLLGAMRVAKNATYKNGVHGRNKRPAYIASVHQYNIRAMGYSEEDFQKYAENLLSEYPAPNEQNEADPQEADYD